MLSFRDIYNIFSFAHVAQGWLTVHQLDTLHELFSVCDEQEKRQLHQHFPSLLNRLA